MVHFLLVKVCDYSLREKRALDKMYGDAFLLNLHQSVAMSQQRCSSSESITSLFTVSSGIEVFDGTF